jgi:hypothetical protein
LFGASLSHDGGSNSVALVNKNGTILSSITVDNVTNADGDTYDYCGLYTRFKVCGYKTYL